MCRRPSARLRLVRPHLNRPWEQKGGTVNDASYLSRTAVAGIVAPRSEKDVAEALSHARAAGLTICPPESATAWADRRSSAAGSCSTCVGSTASSRIRNLDRDGRLGRVVARHPERDPSALRGQGDASTDIFTVGGSISVNAHGMDH